MPDLSELDEIMADSAPAAEVVIPEPAPTATTDATQPRAADGKFAPKATDAVDDAARAAVEQTPTITAQPETATTVPLSALHAQREENKELKRLLQQALTRPAAVPQAQPQTEAKGKEFWEDPDGYIAERMNPVQGAVQQAVLRTSKMLAMQQHGGDVVKGAFDAIASALETDPSAQFEYQRIMASEHPYDALVTWHKGAQARARVGNDPDAWLNAEIEKRMADPAFQASVIERARGSAANGNRAPQPLTQIPPSLGRIPTGGNAAVDDDTSDAGIFAHAMSR